MPDDQNSFARNLLEQFRQIKPEDLEPEDPAVVDRLLRDAVEANYTLREGQSKAARKLDAEGMKYKG